MGIKHLWGILEPFCDRKPMNELHGKKVAIDLSGWVCEAQNIVEYQVKADMHLRQLYFRTCFLLLEGVHPVFVLEGDAPKLKFNTIKARNEIQFKGAKPKVKTVIDDKPKNLGKVRGRFIHVLKECEEMLRCMGLACITAKGEAECLCAHLNERGLVDGVISQDSDCFAYGAEKVYRNFSISSTGTGGVGVDVYDFQKVKDAIDFGRNKVIATAIILGCDYSTGANGVGKYSLLKLFEHIPDCEILDRLRSWKNATQKYKEMENILLKKKVCASCGHNGSVKSHEASGCHNCKTKAGCSNERYMMKTEITIRSKTLENPEFPEEEIIDEFLKNKEDAHGLNLSWKQPNLIRFMKFRRKLEWDQEYAFEKFLPILTRWQCKYPETLKAEKLKGLLIPTKIKKARSQKGVPSYEIIWSDPHNFFKGLIPADKMNNETFLTSREPQDIVEKAYPQLVEEFANSKKKPLKAPTRIKKKEEKKLHINDNNGVQKLPVNNKQKNLDSYLKLAVTNSLQQQRVYEQLHQSKTLHSSFDANMSNFHDESEECDLSAIIEGIMDREPQLYTQQEEVSFFISKPTSIDAFEITFNNSLKDFDDGSDIENEL